MDTLLPIIQVVLALLLIIAILLQRSSQGIEGAIGGGSGPTVVKRKRRGFEKFIFESTIALTIIFVLSILLPLAL
jgi:protein translocase SecG subunit